MAGKGSVKLGFEKQIWDAACVLWDIYLQLNIEKSLLV